MLKRKNDALPKITIVIPSYNKADTISQTLDSIINQKYTNLEVYVKDGGSDDGTLDIIKNYSKKYRFIKYISKKDKGQKEAINLGFSKSTGQILGFINADDIYEANSFNNVAGAYVKNKNSLWFAGFGKIINSKGSEIAYFWSNIKNTLLTLNSYSLLLMTSNYLYQPSVFITANAFKKYGPFTGVSGYIFEYEMWLKLGGLQMPVIIPRYLSRFRIGNSNMSSVYFNKLFKKDIDVTQKYTNSKLIILIHKLNNWLRLITIKLINK